MKLTNAQARKLIAKSQLEDPIHVAILNLLDRALPKGASPAWHTPNGGNRSMREGVKMKRLGTKAGFPDLAWLWNSKFYAFEVKRLDGTQEQNQKDWQKWIEGAGGLYAVVRSVDEAEAQLIAWGIIS